MYTFTLQTEQTQMKLKPQTYSGKDDFEDFLTQFEITSESGGS